MSTLTRIAKMLTGSPFASQTVAELCATRDEVDAELHRRAVVAAESRGKQAIDYTGSVTVISRDGTEVLVSFYREYGLEPAGSRASRFPGYGGMEFSAAGNRSFLASDILPLSVYEGGPKAIAEWEATREAERARQHEVYEREQYEKLRAKFGDAT